MTDLFFHPFPVGTLAQSILARLGTGIFNLTASILKQIRAREPCVISLELACKLAL